MGKTKTKFIDDSAPVEEVKKSEPKKIVKDELVEKLKAELGLEETAKPAETTGSKKEEKQEKKGEETQVLKAKPRSKKYQEVSKNLDKSKT